MLVQVGIARDGILRGRNSYHRKAESNMIILLLGLLQLGHGQSNQIKATRYREHQESFLTKIDPFLA